jgi:hypothetical protein
MKARINWDRAKPRSKACEEQSGKLWSVAHPKHDSITLAQAQTQQTASQSPCPPVEFPVRQLTVPESQSGSITVDLGRLG